jgi:hypothetical protein
MTIDAGRWWIDVRRHSAFLRGAVNHTEGWQYREKAADFKGPARPRGLLVGRRFVNSYRSAGAM